MAKIHGAVYLGIGIFVSLVSYFSPNDSLKFFLYIGFLFGIIGIFKLFVSGLSKKKEKPSKQKRDHFNPKQYQKISKQEQRLFTKQCARCGNLVRHFDNFCARCGQALLHRRK